MIELVFSKRIDDDMEEPQIDPEAAYIEVSARERLLEEAKRWLGKDASPKNLAPKEVSCAEGVSNIICEAGFTTIPRDVLSTAELDYYLDESADFKDSKIPRPGSVIISPRTATKFGHVGIFLENLRIASNDSRTGKFEDNYSLDSWSKTFGSEGRGLKIYIYEPA